MYPSDLRTRLRARLDPDPVPEPEQGDRLAAVVVPVIDGSAPSVVFTKRTEEMSRHAGEVSFPGGLAEPQDGDLVATALRETREELGIDPALVTIVGALPPVHTFVSEILVVPFVGVLAVRPDFSPSAAEIAEVLEFGVAELAAAEAMVRWRRSPDGGEFVGHAYEMGSTTIWGATGKMLHDFIGVLREETPWVLRN